MFFKFTTKFPNLKKLRPAGSCFLRWSAAILRPSLLQLLAVVVNTYIHTLFRKYMYISREYVCIYINMHTNKCMQFFGYLFYNCQLFSGHTYIHIFRECVYLVYIYI